MIGKKSKQETKNEPWRAAQPYILGAAQNLQNTYQQNQPALQQSANTINALIPQLASRVQESEPLNAASRAYLGDVIGGKYLDEGNPYLQSMIDQTGNSVRDQVASVFSRAGRTGSSANQGVLGRELANAENTLRFQNYNTERDRMGNAVGMASSIGSADLGALLQAAQTGGSLPYLGSSAYANGVQGLFSPYGTSTTTQSKGLGSSLMDIAGLAAVAFSDRRKKVAVKRVGTFSDGLGVYEYHYRGGKRRHRGVMADEVRRLRPWAMGPRINGFDTVDYGRL